MGVQNEKRANMLLNKFTHYVYNNLLVKKNILIVTVNIEKCFETLNKSIVLKKLETIGITESALQ